MKKIIELKSLRLCLVAQILIMSVGVAKESTVSPCERALYDADHEIVRSIEMLRLIYKSNAELREYASCYLEITGIDLGVEKYLKRDRLKKGLFTLLVGGWVAYKWYTIDEWMRLDWTSNS